MATVNKDFRVKNGLVVEGTTATVGGNAILTTASTVDADSVVEGTTNLFFTDARAVAAVEGTTLNNVTVETITGVLGAVSVSGILQQSGTNTAYALQSYVDSAVSNANVGSTDEVSEGTTNLYFTDARALFAVQYNLTADEVIEGTSNLFFTDARAVAAVEGASFTSLSASTVNISEMAIDGAAGTITSAGSFTIDSANSITLDASEAYEGSIHLNSNIEGGVYINSSRVATQTYVNTAVSNLVDSAPGTLDTLNELAAALGDDPNFATTITDLIANQTTDGVAEGSTNLYFTDARAVAAVDGATLNNLTVETITGVSGAVSVSGILQQSGSNAAYALQSYVDSAVSGATLGSTDELSEGSTNLYFTDARAVSAVEGAVINPATVRFGSEYDTELTRIGASFINGTSQTVGTLPSFIAGAKLLVLVRDASSNHIEISEVLVALNDGNAYVTEYGNVVTDGSLGELEIDGSGNVTYTSSTAVSVEVAVTAQWASTY